MKILIERHIFNTLMVLMLFVSAQGIANAATTKSKILQGPALNLSINYYDRSLTAEGVLRESHFEENMLRRPGHVWVMRVLPKFAVSGKAGHVHSEHETEHEHKHFNPVVLPRHISLEDGVLKVAYIDRGGKELINIVATEYENVNFDGSWVNAYFLVDPQLVAAMPISNRHSPVANAHWHEQEMHGVFQRVLWDDKKMIPLEVETGKFDGTLLRRVSVKIVNASTSEAPWENLRGYSQREYSDFLD